MATAHRSIAQFPAIDPERAQTILRPERAATDYWIGAPSVLYEPERGRFFLSYRERRPRGAHADRGWRCAIAESTDGVTFRDVWEIHKHDLDTSSMERFSLIGSADGRYQLFLSYVDPADNRWRIDVVSADAPDEFKVGDAAAALTAESTGTEGVKDPYTLRVGPAIYMFVSHARSTGMDAAQRDVAHSTADIYATGVTDHPTGLAISTDARHFDWRPGTVTLGTDWDRWSVRLTTIVSIDGAFMGLYDGAASAAENYQERTGLAISFDLHRWTHLTQDEPALFSRHGTNSLRYADAVPVGDELFIYFEYAMPDGSHELRLSRVPWHGHQQPIDLTT